MSHQLINSIRQVDVGAVRNLLKSDSELVNQPIAANPAEQTNAE